MIGILVGTRPEIIKMAPVIRACRVQHIPLMLIHTGQHYSYALDTIFFEELNIPPPDINLHVGSGSSTYQISAIIERLGRLGLEQKIKILLVQGDTNSVLAGALAARALNIPVGHVEAGLRSYDRLMIEETNRILTDHLAACLFAPTNRARETLLGEQIAAERIYLTGNTVVDELLLQRPRFMNPGVLDQYQVQPSRYILATVHRQENVDRPERLRDIFLGLAKTAKVLEIPVLAVLHPRTAKKLVTLNLSSSQDVRYLPPLGYFEFLGLQAQAGLVLTDSGGVQEEACCLRVPCVTLRTTTERPESIDVGANCLAGADPEKIVSAARIMIDRPRTWANPFGDGHSGERIVEILQQRQ